MQEIKTALLVALVSIVMLYAWATYQTGSLRKANNHINKSGAAAGIWAVVTATQLGTKGRHTVLRAGLNKLLGFTGNLV